MPGLSLVHISICGSLKRSCSSPVPCCSSSCSSLGRRSSGRSAMRVETSSVWSRSKTSNSFFLDSKTFRCCVLQIHKVHSCIHSSSICLPQGSDAGSPEWFPASAVSPCYFGDVLLACIPRSNVIVMHAKCKTRMPMWRLAAIRSNRYRQGRLCRYYTAGQPELALT